MHLQRIGEPTTSRLSSAELSYKKSQNPTTFEISLRGKIYLVSVESSGNSSDAGVLSSVAILADSYGMTRVFPCAVRRLRDE